ncbi:endonuclease domain-containing protein [Arthrobacter sp. G.S.26]|uniref:endonuclease domain-containing protein n=1 Tax=Arthrobacter sp. G.S.26 TaxID=3433706 RepID=UPI003D77CC62
MKTPRPLPVQLDLAAFTFQEAVDAGVSFRRLRHVSLHSPSRGIRVPSGGPRTGPACGNTLEDVRPFSQVTSFSAASHATAFVLWGFPGFLPGSKTGLIHISRPDTMAIVRRRGVVGHVGQFFDDEITNLNGLLITTRLRTWLDCSRRMSVEEITVVADHLVRHPRPEFEGRTEPYATPGDLADMLDRHKGTPGIQKARLALERSRVGSDSAQETRLRLALEDAGLPEPELNAPTDLGFGVVRQPDLSYPEYKVAAEYEGEGHSDAAQIVRDIAREEDFSRAGWLLMRISKRHMRHEAGAAVRKVRAAMLDRGWPGR